MTEPPSALRREASARGLDFARFVRLVGTIVDEVASHYRRDFDAPSARLLAILQVERDAHREPRPRGQSRGYFTTDLVPRAGLRGRGSIDRMKQSLGRKGILRPVGGRGKKRALWVFDRSSLNREMGKQRMYEDLLDAMGLWPKMDAETKGRPRLKNPPPISYDARGETVWYGFGTEDSLRRLLEPLAEEFVERVLDVLVEGDYPSPGDALEQTLHKFVMIDLNAILLMRFPWREWGGAYEDETTRKVVRRRIDEMLREVILPRKLNLGWARCESPDVFALASELDIALSERPRSTAPGSGLTKS